MPDPVYVHTYIHTYMQAHADACLYKVKLLIVFEGDPRAPFSIAMTPRCRGGRDSLP